MKVEVLYINECPNWVEAQVRLRAALDAAGYRAVDIASRLLTTREEAGEVPFAGSPTILINGQDAFPEGARTSEFACRVYGTETGIAGVPSREQLSAVIGRISPPQAEQQLRIGPAWDCCGV